MTGNVSNIPLFTERHSLLLKAATSTVAVVAGCAAAYFIAQGGSLALAAGIPLSLISLTSGGCLIKVLITKPTPPPKEEEPQPPPKKVPPTPKPPPKIVKPPLKWTIATWHPLMDTPRPEVEEIDETSPPIQVEPPPSYAPLFAESKKFYATLLNAYEAVYGEDMQPKIGRIDQCMDAWHTDTEQALQDEDFVIWMGLDSLFVLKNNLEELTQFRSGKLTVQKVKPLLKEKLGYPDMLPDTLIDAWWADFANDACFNPADTDTREKLLDAYKKLSEEERTTLANALAKLNYTRTEFAMLDSWKLDIKEPILDTKNQTMVAKEVNFWLIGEWMLSEQYLPKMVSNKIHNKLAPQLRKNLQHTPNERYFQHFLTLGQELMLPIGRAIHKKSLIHKKLYKIAQDMPEHEKLSDLVNFLEQKLQKNHK